MDNGKRNRIKRATVTVIGNEESDIIGQGFAVAGEYIVTAAHCLPWSCEGGMLDCTGTHVEIITADGNRLLGKVVTVDPISDIAIIGPPDSGYFSEEAEIFDRFVKSVEGLLLSGDELPIGQEVLVHVFTHSGEWLSGHASQWSDNAPILHLESLSIPSGTSGSAIVNDCGEVVGVASDASTSGDGTCPRPCQSLPVWLWRAIKAAEADIAHDSGEVADCVA